MPRILKATVKEWKYYKPFPEGVNTEGWEAQIPNVNPSTPNINSGGLPSTRAQAEGPRVDPEQHFTHPL